MEFTLFTNILLFFKAVGANFMYLNHFSQKLCNANAIPADDSSSVLEIRVTIFFMKLQNSTYTYELKRVKNNKMWA